jgi:hypothetical protein
MWARVTATRTASRTTGCRAPNRCRINPAAAELQRGIVLVGDQQPVEPGPASIKEVAGPIRCERHVRHHRDAGEPQFDLAHMVKARLAFGKKIENGQVHGFVFARRNHLGPRLARKDSVLSVHGVDHALQTAVIGEEGGDDAHFR